jgi:hypothetical protein
MSGLRGSSDTISLQAFADTCTEPLTTDEFPSTISNFPLAFWIITAKCRLPVKKQPSINVMAI